MKPSAPWRFFLLTVTVNSIFFQAIVNSSYVGHAKAGDRSHRGGKRATNPAALKTSPTTHTSSEPNDAPMSAAKKPQQTGHEEKNTGGGRHGRLHVREKGVIREKKITPQSGRCGSGGRGDAGAMEAGALSSPDQQPPTRASRQVHAAGAVAKRGGGSRRQAAEEDQHPGGRGTQNLPVQSGFFCWGEWRAKVALRIEAEQGSTRTRINQRRKKRQRQTKKDERKRKWKHTTTTPEQRAQHQQHATTTHEHPQHTHTHGVLFREGKEGVS